jgi:hypothetical protein
METLFGHDFSQVRVHANTKAAESTRVLNARAYTAGLNIVFGSRQYAPNTGPGRRLLVHELTHVVQQVLGLGGSDERLEHEAERAEHGQVPSVITGGVPKAGLLLSPDRAKRLVIVLTGDSRAQFTVYTDIGESLSGTGSASGIEPGTYQVYYDSERGKLMFSAEDGSDLALGENFYIEFLFVGGRMLRLLRAATEAIPMEVRSGETSSDTAERGQTAEPSEVTSLRQAISNLPERIREFIFSETSTCAIQSSDYPAILRIAEKLMQLSDSELESYRARTIGTTRGLATFETSVDRYIAEVHQRRESVLERERTKLRLYGLDEVYHQYERYIQDYNRSSRLAAASDDYGGMSTSMQDAINRMRVELTTNLQRYGFNSISEFEQSIREFETAFRNETVLIAREMLDRYEHVLVEQEQRYRNSAETAALHQQLQPARQHFQEAADSRPEHVMTPETTGMPGMIDTASTARVHASCNLKSDLDLYEAAMTLGRSATTALSSTHPLLGSQDFPHEALAMASNVQTVIEPYIRARRSDVQQTRQNLASTPDMVFELDVLLQRAYIEQNIRPDSIYHRIIENHIRNTQVERVLVNLAIAVFTIAAGLVSGGTGTVAILGATTALGIGAYQAVEEFRRYERGSAAHGAQLLSEDPSFAWVVVAIVGAGIDLTAAAAAIRLLRPAVKAFNTMGDLAVFEQKVARLTQVEERIRTNVIRAAEAEVQARAAWQSVVRPPATLRAVIIPGAEEFGMLVYAVYLSARRGIISFERFVLTQEAVDLIGDVARLSPEDLTSLKAAYTQAITDSQNITMHARSLGMADNAIEFFMRNPHRWTAEQVMREMDTWHKTGRIPLASDWEHAIDELLRSEGRLVQPNVLEGVQGSGSQGDRLIDGVLTEYKTLQGVEKLTSDGLSSALSSRIMDARGQAVHIIVNTHSQDGMTKEIAERGIIRAYGADNKTGAKIQSIRAIGDGFDITELRRGQ